MGCVKPLLCSVLLPVSCILKLHNTEFCTIEKQKQDQLIHKALAAYYFLIISPMKYEIWY